jgi:hypothetical protein
MPAALDSSENDEARRQSCPAIPDLLRADQAEGRILRQPLCIVHIFVSRQAAVDRVPDAKRLLGSLLALSTVRLGGNNFSTAQSRPLKNTLMPERGFLVRLFPFARAFRLVLSQKLLTLLHTLSPINGRESSTDYHTNWAT